MTKFFSLTNSHRKHNILIYQTITIQAGFMVKETTIEKGKYSIIMICLLYLNFWFTQNYTGIRAGNVFVNISSISISGDRMVIKVHDYDWFSKKISLCFQ
jgi:hypothetical protein